MLPRVMDWFLKVQKLRKEARVEGGREEGRKGFGTGTEQCRSPDTHRCTQTYSRPRAHVQANVTVEETSWRETTFDSIAFKYIFH